MDIVAEGEKALRNFLDNRVDGLRRAYTEGCNKTKKALMEWIEEQLTILDKQTLLHPDDDVFWTHRNLFKEMKDKINSL